MHGIAGDIKRNEDLKVFSSRPCASGTPANSVSTGLKRLLECTYFCESLKVIFVELSTQLTRTPSATIFENEPLLILLPHDSSELVARSRSTIRGGISAILVKNDLETSTDHRRKS